MYSSSSNLLRMLPTPLYLYPPPGRVGEHRADGVEAHHVGLQGRIDEPPVPDRLLSVAFRIIGLSKGLWPHRSPHEPGECGDGEQIRHHQRKLIGNSRARGLQSQL